MSWNWILLFIAICALGQFCVFVFERWFAKQYGEEALHKVSRTPVTKIKSYLASQKARKASVQSHSSHGSNA
jgi:hypothetical protein